jgi:hypothetical protein
MTFENQNARAKIRLELSEGVVVEVPLVVVVRAIQERYAAARDGGITLGGEDAPTSKKDLVHWGFPDFFSDDPAAMVHLIVTTLPGVCGLLGGE